MENNMINELFVQFNSLVDSLIEDFKEFNQNEEVLVFLAGKTKNFLDFTELTFLNVIFKFLSTLDTVNEGFSKEIGQSEELIKQIFDNIRGILDRIVIEDEEEEHGHSHGCGHSHGHEHHHHINMDGVQEDLDKIVDDLDRGTTAPFPHKIQISADLIQICPYFRQLLFSCTQHQGKGTCI